MKLEVKIQLLKFCSQIFNSILLVLGLSLGGCGVWILFDRGSLLTVLPSEDVRTVGAGLLFIGGLVLVVSVVGFVAAFGNRFLLLVYLVFLIVLVLGQLFVILLLLINRDQIERTLEETVDDIILHYGGNRTSLDRLMDNIQKYGKCCGRTGPSDWLRNSYVQSLNMSYPHVLPCSCFTSCPSCDTLWCSHLLDAPVPPSQRGNVSYEEGCKKQLSVWLQENLLTIVGMDFSLVLIQVLQFVITVYLYGAFSRKTALKTARLLLSSDHAHPDHAHMDHTPDVDITGQNDAHTDSGDSNIYAGTLH